MNFEDDSLSRKKILEGAEFLNRIFILFANSKNPSFFSKIGQYLGPKTDLYKKLIISKSNIHNNNVYLCPYWLDFLLTYLNNRYLYFKGIQVDYYTVLEVKSPDKSNLITQIIQRIGDNAFNNKEYLSICATWSDWFEDSPDMIITNVFEYQISLTNDTHVFFCAFFNIVSSITMNPGSSINISLCVEECSFINCYRNGDGGAIYCYDIFNCVFNKICSFQCNTSKNWVQFCYVRVKLDSFNRNIANLVSICKCAQIDNSNIYCSVDFRHGNISLNNLNSSANVCYRYSGFRLDSPSISNIRQSSFCNNTDYYICIGFITSIHHLSQCNIICNHQKQTNYGTIYDYGSAITTISSCVINLQTGAIIIIYVRTGGCVTLQNCYLQSNLQIYGNVNIQLPITDNHTLILNHFESHMCSTFKHILYIEVNTTLNLINYDSIKVINKILLTNFLVTLYQLFFNQY